MKCNARVYLVEGNTESKLVKALIQGGILSSGSVKIFNCWYGKIDSLLRGFPKSSKTDVYVIFDTDTMTSISEFVGAIQSISKVSNRLVLLQQTLNFEDELCYACVKLNPKTTSELFRQFNAQGADDFKRSFLRITNCVNRLSDLGFNKKLIWSRELHHNIRDRLSKVKYKIGL